MNNPLWLDVVRHRLRRVRAPFLLVLQHHDLPSATRLVAPVVTLPGESNPVAPALLVGGRRHCVRLLDIAAVPVSGIGETIMSAAPYRSEIADALDIVLFGYPVGRPR